MIKNDKYTVYSKQEFIDKFEEGREMPEVMTGKYIYVSNIDTCPYIGVEYEDGELWVFGIARDRKVNRDELEKCMEVD